MQSGSTVDAIRIIMQIVEKAYEHNVLVEMLFIDFKRAFLSIKIIERIRSNT